MKNYRLRLLEIVFGCCLSFVFLTKDVYGALTCAASGGVCQAENDCYDEQGTVSAATGCTGGNVCCIKTTVLPYCGCGSAAGNSTETVPTSGFCDVSNSYQYDVTTSTSGKWSWHCYKAGICQRRTCTAPKICECGKVAFESECVSGTVSENMTYDELTGVDWWCKLDNVTCSVSKMCHANFVANPCAPGECTTVDSCLNVNGVQTYNVGATGSSVGNYFCNLVSPETPICCTRNCSNRLDGSCVAVGRCIDSNTTSDGCSNGDEVCCTTLYHQNECDSNYKCQIELGYGPCYTCDFIPPTSTSTGYNECIRHINAGTAGNCEDYTSTDSFCSYAEITSKCDSSYGYTSGVTNPEEGDNFTWTCKGQPASTCVTAGSTSGTCSVARTVTVSGQCGTTVGTCVSGTAEGVGITQVTATGIDDVWTCGGTCSGTDASCRVTKCTNSTVVGGGCKSGVKGTTYDDLCYQGTLDYASNDANHDYINDTNPTEYVWSCLGSTHTCAEADGNDSLDCKSQIDQDAWFRTTGGRVLSKGIVNNYVPLTCEEKCYTTDRMVLTKGRDNLASHDPSKKYNGRDYSRKTYSYDFLKGRYLTARGVGTTINQSAKWSEISSNKGIIFINGDLTIDVNLETTDFMMLIAKNNIIIENTVNRIDGILTGKNIIASGESADQLIINGMVYGTKGVEFSRSFSSKNINNTKPAVEVIHNPGLIFKIPKEAGKWVTQYKVNI